MTFLLDYDTPDDTAYSLETLGHQVVRLREVLPIDSSDTAILAHAQAQAWVMITCNRDDYLALGKVQPHAGIIIPIRRKTRVGERAALVRLLDAAGESGIRNNINFA